MSSAFFVHLQDNEPDYIFDPDDLAEALALFFSAIRDGAEEAQIRWSA